ncbi:MFS multidrug transporter [Rhypophila decipiens]
MRVPTTNQVLPGAFVNIVLKADQPTGRTVSGRIQDVLTRGNHPRGIKVRLSDGRVGRVQSMVSSSSSTTTTTINVHFGGSDAGRGRGRGRGWGRGRGGRGNRYARDDYTYDAGDRGPSDQPALSLEAYIRPARNQRGQRGTNQGQGGNSTRSMATSRADIRRARVETSTCPVCGVFEGDETAVTHHVATHFTD